MEEFSGGGQDLVSKLTEIRSSNVVRLTRVNGTVQVPAMVRMLSISNPATDSSGNSIPMRQYANGVKLLLDLVGAAEDIARYDFFVLMPKPTGYISPLDDVKLDSYDKESYMNRVRWIWSRKAEQILIDDNTKRYIVDVAEQLNSVYDSHINFFGAEAWKKLARLAIACAACVCSMDATGENLVVTADHVTWARKFLVSCYDNNFFKLREYVAVQRSYSECDPAAVHAMQGIYDSNKTLMLQLEMATEMSRQHLQAISGLDQKGFSEVMNRMFEYRFISYQGERLIPSERFREAMRRINRNSYMKRVGE
jgi:hypothetical protein